MLVSRLRIFGTGHQHTMIRERAAAAKAVFVNTEFWTRCRAKEAKARSAGTTTSASCGPFSRA